MQHIMPRTCYRQIGTQKWQGAINIMKQNEMNHIIVSWFYTGWVFIVDLDRHESNKFNCCTYKIGTDPSKIKKELYNYTKNYGNLINVNIIYD